MCRMLLPVRARVVRRTPRTVWSRPAIRPIINRSRPAARPCRSGRRPAVGLFNAPGRIEGPVLNPDGERVTSFALTNVRAAYGLDLKYLKDSDGDGFPDVIDPAPFWPGYKDGEH